MCVWVGGGLLLMLVNDQIFVLDSAVVKHKLIKPCMETIKSVNIL